MYPLLVNAIASTASTLLDRWSSSAQQKSIMESDSFRQMMDKVAASAQSAALAAANPAAAKDATVQRLHAQLMDSPEVRLAIDSADPSKPVSIQVSPDGKVTAQTGGGWPQPIQLSPDTAAIARELGKLSQPAPAISSSLGLKSATFQR